MGFLHSSRARGRVPAALRAAADVRFVGLDGDGDATILHFTAPRFETVARDLFRQGTLWESGPQPHDTAFELFGAALRDVRTRREDGDTFDRGLLTSIRGYRSVLAAGVTQIDMPDTPVDRRGRIDTGVVEAARELMAATPQSRRVRVAGRLDAMGVSEAVMKIEVEHNAFVTAVWEGDEAVHSFRDLLNRDVVVEGLGVFRPSGSLLRIDADVLTPASTEDAFFRTVPSAPVLRDYQRLTRINKAGEPSAYRQLLGSIPAGESDDEFEAALAALR
jgi:hypothetical protein